MCSLSPIPPFILFLELSWCQFIDSAVIILLSLCFPKHIHCISSAALLLVANFKAPFIAYFSFSAINTLFLSLVKFSFPVLRVSFLVIKELFSAVLLDTQAFLFHLSLWVSGFISSEELLLHHPFVLVTHSPFCLSLSRFLGLYLWAILHPNIASKDPTNTHFWIPFLPFRLCQLGLFRFSEIKMFEGLLKPKFYSRCKSCVKLIKTRLETTRKKRNAVQKFLKKDISDLLRSALDHNAYGRAEGLLVEQNMSSCYELIAKFIGCISDHVQDLCKQRDCPEECKEAIPSLMYAAARFSDLPELRELRTLFTEKFGNSLEPYTSKEFVEKLRQDPPSKEMKIQLLRDLAQEFSIEWDGKALEQRLYKPPPLHEERPKHDPLNDSDNEKRHENNDVAIPKTDNLVTGGKERDGRECSTYKGNERDTLSRGRKDISDYSWRLESSSDDETSTDMSSQDDPKTCSSSLGSVSEDEVEIKRPFSYRLVPPPYLKQKSNEGESNLKKTTESAALPENEPNHDLHEPVVPKKPIPRSVRRRPLKPPVGYDTVSDSKTGDSAKLDSGGMKSEKAKQPQRTELADDGDSRDEEERIMDGLLKHYSKKQSPYESGKGKAYAKAKAYPSPQLEYDNGKNRRHTKSVSGVPLFRETPLETTTSMEASKGHARATSLAPEMLSSAGHVHPNLPDYDDLAARLAVLRGR